jgi:hypothetical protein
MKSIITYPPSISATLTIGVAAALPPYLARAGHAAYYSGSRFVSSDGQKTKGCTLLDGLVCEIVLTGSVSFHWCMFTAKKEASERASYLPFGRLVL